MRVRKSRRDWKISRRKVQSSRAAIDHSKRRSRSTRRLETESMSMTLDKHNLYIPAFIEKYLGSRSRSTIERGEIFITHKKSKKLQNKFSTKSNKRWDFSLLSLQVVEDSSENISDIASSNHSFLQSSTTMRVPFSKVIDCLTSCIFLVSCLLSPLRIRAGGWQKNSQNLLFIDSQAKINCGERNSFPSIDDLRLIDSLTYFFLYFFSTFVSSSTRRRGKFQFNFFDDKIKFEEINGF